MTKKLLVNNNTREKYRLSEISPSPSLPELEVPELSADHRLQILQSQEWNKRVSMASLTLAIYSARVFDGHETDGRDKPIFSTK